MSEAQIPAKKPRGVRKDRHCHQCRLKGAKCDLNRPTCQLCQQTGASCRYPHRVKWMTDTNLKPDVKDHTARKGASQVQRIPNKNSSKCPPTDSSSPINLYGFIDLISHFYQDIQTSSQDLPDETIQLISRTLNFAKSRLQGPDWQSIQSHLVALTNLSQVIESGHPIALFGIATFAIFEVCCGPFGQWHRHLHGARSLLDIHCRSKGDIGRLASQMPGLTDVLAYLVWFDVTGALIRESDLIFDDWHREIMSSQFLASVGCPPDTFELLAHLSKPGTSLDSTDLSARAMEQTLCLDSSDGTDRGLTALIYRCTAAMGALGILIAGKGEGSPSARYENVISSLVDRVCGAISKIPRSSQFYVHLATPAYLTGVYASQTQQCEILRSYWRSCRLCDFPRYPDAQHQCEVRWRNRMIV
ncbi:Protein of unknown function DUF3468 [Penicillium chermesinum]|nr:Protein of unknown function DUF3468 [Penicillium chermesinum]